MFSEDGCPGACDDYPASELGEPVVVFTKDGIGNLRHIVDERRAAGHVPQNLRQRAAHGIVAAAAWLRFVRIAAVK